MNVIVTIAVILLLLGLLGVTGILAALRAVAWLFLIVGLILLIWHFFAGRRAAP